MKDAKGTTVIADNQYSYNNAGDITQNIDQSGTHGYGYDVVQRLTSATYTGTPNETYAYDGVGNRTSSHKSPTYGYQPNNRLVSTSTASYIYNNNGNLISKSDASGTTQYVWDFENRLTQVVTPASGSVTYKYDALGRRIQRTPSSGISTNFVYDGQDVVKDINSDGSTVEYLHGPGVDNKIRQKGSSTSTTYYFSQDHLGSTTALTGPSRTEMFCISSSKICRLSRWPTVSALRYLEQLEPKRLLNYGATMYLDNIGEIIARRELHVGNPTEPQRKVQVLIGKPVAFPDSGGYYCPFQIVGVGAEQIKYAAGVDAIQSLQLVMLMLGATLQFLNEGLNGTLRWEGSSEGEFGFPTSE